MINTLLVILSLISLATLGALVWVLKRLSAKQPDTSPAVNQSLDALLRDTRDLRVDQKLIRESSHTLNQDLRSLADLLQQFKIRQEERNHREEEYTSSIKDSIKGIEHLFKGSKSKGMAGENILREIFKIFPPELIVFDYKVEGRPVEFGLKLPDGRIVPMDSKVVALEEMNQLVTENNEDTRQKLIKKIETEVMKKIKEVAEYVHPPITWDRALMMVPDAIYSILKESFTRAYSQSVILIPFSMAVPYILTFLDLHKKTLATYDEQQVHAFLEDLDRALGEMDTVLENQIARGNTMIGNAYTEYKKIVGKVRGRMTYLAEAEKPQLLKSTAPKEEPELVKQP
ncbi:MAG: DNA recombination protein RmuC [Patescibacteria group bacterium]|jgi:DNA recombination protein RmuC